MAKPGHLDRAVSRVRGELHASLTEETTPHRVATSVALGTFITMLPTLGTGLLVFLVLVAAFDWVNRVALFASVLVFNPVVKWGVYAASLALGFALLGPVDGVSPTDRPGLGDGSAIVVRLLVGNGILAVVATVAAYVVADRIADRYDDGDLPVLEGAVDGLVDSIEQRDERIGDSD